MATVTLTGTDNGDLGYNSTYNYGYDGDTVTASATWTGDPTSGFYIATYECSDIINTSANTFAGSKVVIFSGSGADTVTGGSGVEHVFDGSNYDSWSYKVGPSPAGAPAPAHDVINLGAGDDIMEVGCGDDTYNGGTHTDGDWLMFRFKSNDGIGALEANTYGVIVDLAKTTAQDWDGVDDAGKPSTLVNHFGTDTISGFENCVGGGGADIIAGTSDVNKLYGADGADKLYGRDGNDKLFGGLGADTLVGGKGADGIYLSGASNSASDTASRDIVLYQAATDSGPAPALRDTIYYFDRGTTASDDRISFAPLDGDTRVSAPGDQQLVWRDFATSFGTDARGEIRLEDLGAHVLIHVDLDADAADEMAIYVFNVPTMSQSDFIL